ncbi:MAG: hypothetical protein ABIK28_14025, partial [Planctomycetota bacterium]
DDNRPEDLVGSIHDDLMYCVMTRTWKLIHRRFHEDASELYCLEDDPRETRNVIQEFPDKRDELFRFLEKPGVMIDELVPAAGESEETKRLREMGY